VAGWLGWKIRIQANYGAGIPKNQQEISNFFVGKQHLTGRKGRTISGAILGIFVTDPGKG
jgi:hypothetical protein